METSKATFLKQMVLKTLLQPGLIFFLSNDLEQLDFLLALQSRFCGHFVVYLNNPPALLQFFDSEKADIE